MDNKNDYKTLMLRNEASLHLDDLTAQVVNSTLANQLRSFSSEIMELTPGFTFTLKQARLLNKLTIQTLDDYKKGTIQDVDLMNFCANAQSILKGDELETGGKRVVGIFDGLFKSKEEKQREALQQTERQYTKVCDEITACQDRMQRYINECKGLSPNSAVYRNNERMYTAEQNKLNLLQKQATELGNLLTKYDQVKLVQDFAKQQEQIASSTTHLFGSEKDRDMALATAEMQTDNIKDSIDKIGDFGASLFAAEEDGYQANSAFGAQVASAERQQTMMDLANATAQATSAANAAPKSAFAAALDAASKAEN